MILIHISLLLCNEIYNMDNYLIISKHFKKKKRSKLLGQMRIHGRVRYSIDIII